MYFIVCDNVTPHVNQYKTIQINMIREGHYPVEKHTVTTEDGYILTVHRLPRPDVKPENRKVILMLHGMS